MLALGGLFVNADFMPDERLPALTEVLGEYDRTRRTAWHAAGAAQSWEGWWDNAGGHPVLGPLKQQRDAMFSIDHTEWTPAADWHVEALRAAGFAEAGLIWRAARDAAVVG